MFLTEEQRMMLGELSTRQKDENELSEEQKLHFRKQPRSRLTLKWQWQAGVTLKRQDEVD